VAGNQNWTSEFSLAFRNLKDLYSFLGWELTPSLEKTAQRYPLFIPRSLAVKIKTHGPDSVLAREFLPHELEIDPVINERAFEDPIGDRKYFKAPQLIHRYKTRALFTPTSICPVLCRYCFRKNELNAKDELFQKDFEKTLRYLRSHPEITEIIFTGGDPLTLSNEKLETYLTAFADLGTIQDVRFHTRYPVILPERLDEDFLKLISRMRAHFRTLSVGIHVNHRLEFDEINTNRIRALHQTGVQLLSQTVLLRGVNDSKEALLDLINTLLDIGVRPYYLHHPDHVKGGIHFYISIQKGREIFKDLRDEIPGWAIPHYVIDIPGGHGKVPAFNPESLSYSGQLISKKGDILEVPEPYPY
jgi:lysine 2,3-aminomutase